MPGQLIEDLLSERGWSQRVLAIVLGVEETGLNKLIAGKKRVDAAMAIALGDVFAPVPPERFMELQKEYDLAMARLVVRSDPGRTTRAHLFGELPITEMIKRRWIDAEDVRDVARVESGLVKFFCVDSADNIPILPHAAKKTEVTGPVTPSQLAWLYRVRQIAREMVVPRRYTIPAARHAVERLSALLAAAEETRHAPRILAEAGIRYVLVESLPSAKIDGVCCWLDGASPVIGMSLRFDRIDNFWWVLRHELEHVIRGHGREAAMIDFDMEGAEQDTPEEELQANEAAREFCVPKKEMDSFIARKQPLFSEKSILGFAGKLNLHPGLVAGQLRHRTKRWDLFAKHLVKVRSAVSPSAMVDGWGDVAPVSQ